MPGSRHCIWALAALSIGASSAHGQSAPAAAAETTFTVFVRGHAIGTEDITVAQSAEGWTITGSNSIAAPIGVAMRAVQIEYDLDWKPRRLSLEGMTGTQPTNVKTSFADGRATNETLEDGRLVTKTDTVSPDAVILPNNFFGAYEAVGRRLVTLSVGADIPVYIAPLAETRLSLTAVDEERIQTPGRTLLVRRHYVAVQNPNGPFPLEVWVDDTSRLARVSVPAIGLDIVREDLATVASRRQTFFRDGDIDVRVPANGFSLAGTISKPRNVADSLRLPAIVLVGGSAPLDRDATMFGVPVFGQLAAMLADAGSLVLRYDKRGIGQSGGRTESVTLADYAEDVRAAVKFLSDRRDVDKKRIVLVGHSEGASVALLAASRDKKVAAVVLLAGYSGSGADLVLEQQAQTLARMNVSDLDRTAKVDMQKRIHQAVLTGEGWATIPADLRRNADNAWFRSFLAFEPTTVMKDVRQPMLVLHGELDRQVPPHHGVRLAELANARKKARPTELVRLDGINHLLTQAATGEIDEYPRLADKQVSPDVGQAIARWLDTVFRPAPRTSAN